MPQQVNEENPADEIARTEGTKLMFDAMKHLTTLSIGSILILVALLEKLFRSPRWRVLLATSFLSFIFSILMSVRLMVFLAGHVARRTDSETTSLIRFYRLAILSFLLAIFCFVSFVLRNLWP